MKALFSRLTIALCCLLLPLTLMAQLPADSAFALSSTGTPALLWPALWLVGGTTLSVVAARLLAR